MKYSTFFKTGLLLFLFFITGNSVIAQSNDAIKAQFYQDIQNGTIKDGCEIIVTLALDGSQAACFIPEPTISKVACSIATIYKAGGTSGEEVFKNAGTNFCQLTVASTKAAVTYTIDFAENTMHEVEATYNWLNTIEGVTWLMYKLK